jgi:hypothetical protein
MTVACRLSLCAAALALAGCATTQRFTPVYCVSPDQLQRLKGAEPPRVGEKLTGQAQDDFKIAAGSAVQLRAWGEGLIGVLEGCQEPPR